MNLDPSLSLFLFPYIQPLYPFISLYLFLYIQTFHCLFLSFPLIHFSRAFPKLRSHSLTQFPLHYLSLSLSLSLSHSLLHNPNSPHSLSLIQPSFLSLSLSLTHTNTRSQSCLLFSCTSVCLSVCLLSIIFRPISRLFFCGLI